MAQSSQFGRTDAPACPAPMIITCMAVFLWSGFGPDPISGPRSNATERDKTMTISVGDTLPEATLIRLGAGGPEQVSLQALAKGRKIVIVRGSGRLYPTCHSAHVPSFIRTKEQFAARAWIKSSAFRVNDPFVMKAGARQRAPTAPA